MGTRVGKEGNKQKVSTLGQHQIIKTTYAKKEEQFDYFHTSKELIVK